MLRMNMKKDEFKDRELFESAIRALEAEIANAGAHLTIDSAARQAYTKQILVMSNELRSMAFTGQITWAKAAEQANEARNTIMSIIRSRSTPVGLAIAESIKQEGKTLNELVARKTVQLFGSGAVFDKLPVEKQNKVFAEIVTAAGKSRPEVTATMMKLSYAGRGLIFLSIAISVYTIATAENKVDAAGKEVAVTGASIAGGMAGGALAGLACGPGAPVCVTVGAFIGGGLAAFGMSVLW
jgi:hypothetical protein